jgi:hypothetical protein
MSPRGLGDIDANQGAHFNRNEWPLLAQSGHRLDVEGCPLLGVKRTSKFKSAISGFDPKRTSRPFIAAMRRPSSFLTWIKFQIAVHLLS